MTDRQTYSPAIITAAKSFLAYEDMLDMRARCRWAFDGRGQIIDGGRVAAVRSLTNGANKASWPALGGKAASVGSLVNGGKKFLDLIANPADAAGYEQPIEGMIDSAAKTWIFVWTRTDVTTQNMSLFCANRLGDSTPLFDIYRAGSSGDLRVGARRENTHSFQSIGKGAPNNSIHASIIRLSWTSSTAAIQHFNSAGDPAVTAAFAASTEPPVSGPDIPAWNQANMKLTLFNRYSTINLASQPNRMIGKVFFGAQIDGWDWQTTDTTSDQFVYWRDMAMAYRAAAMAG